MIGQVIAQYTILEKIGEGGMGVVYKAHDTKLDRVVALKFLPHHLTIHEEEKARFLQEARAASALNHPNVCVIHDLQEYNGEHFIVMEFIEGGTLRERVSSAAAGRDRFIPLETVITYAVQIGEALQEAHSKGIVHRDVKAENIMVTPKGQIKVMDFGLAKLKGSLKLTRTSSTVGTLAYMAPEQIQGGEVDARSDIFSFGVVLYEMLTGITPFKGGHEAAMMYSILNEEPQPADQVRAGLSHEVMHVVDRALEKNPEDRYQSVGEMVIDLRRLKRQSTKVTRSIAGMPIRQTTDAEPPPVVSPDVSRRSTVRRLILPVGGGLILILLVTLWFAVFRHGGAGEAGKIGSQASFRVLQIPFMQVSYPALSQDGGWVAFPAAGSDGRWDVYFMNALAGGPRRVTADSSFFVNQTDISPDGSEITYDKYATQAGITEVFAVSSLGGLSRRLASPGILPRWNPDGRRIGYMLIGSNSIAKSHSGKLELWSVRSDGSDQRLEYRDSISVRGRFSFSWSPDGRSIAWIRSYPEGYQEVLVHDLETGKELQLTHDRKNIDEVCWTHQGEIIFSSNKSGNMNLWIVPDNGGEETQLTKGSGPDFGIKISADGTKALYYQYQPVQNVWISGIDGSNAHQVTSEDRQLDNPAFSPDGSRIAVVEYDVDPAKTGRTLVIVDRNGGNRREITSGRGIAERPLWSPDGKWIAFLTHQVSEPHDAFAQVAIIDAGNPVEVKILMRGLAFRWRDATTLWVADGKNCYRVPIDGGKPDVIIEDSAIVLPVLHGKCAVYWSSSDPSSPLFCAPVLGTRLDRSRAVKLNPGTFTDGQFGHDDTYVLMVMTSGQFLKVALPSGRSTVLSRQIPSFTGLGTGFGLDAKGKEIVYTDQKLNGKLVMIEHLR